MSGDFPVHGGDLTWAARRYRRDPREFLDFSANVNPLGPPPVALEAAREALAEASLYPEPDAGSLRAALARFLDVDPGLLTLGNGSTELIHHLVRCLAPAKVAVAVPAFCEYERAARNVGADILWHRLDPGRGFALDAEGFAAASAEADLAFFCNPASPSGRLYRREELLPALDACRRRGGILAVDESFMGFCTAEEAARASLMPEAGSEGLVVISTLTKLFALAGLRGPGWLAGPRELVGELEEKAVAWRVNAVAAAAAAAALSDAAYLAETREKVAAWREELARRMEASGMFQVFPSHANYLLLRVTRPDLAADFLADRLGERGILVRLCGNFRGLEQGFIRVAVLDPERNRRLVEEMEEIAALDAGDTGPE